MFEYLMPALVMRSPEGSLLSQTYELVVRRQIEYGASAACRGECRNRLTTRATWTSPINTPALACPGLGLKRGLSEDIVIAPYATALAAMIDPAAALENFARLEEAGAAGTYGFYEALDYTTHALARRKGLSPSCVRISRTIRECR